MNIPAISTIEFTNACNFSCKYCQRTDEDGIRTVGMLKPALVELMLSRGDFDGTTYCEFQQNGEPTLHKFFAQLVYLIKSKVPYVGLSTNGTYHILKHRTSVLMALRECHCITLSIHPETTQFDVDNMVKKMEGFCPLRIQTLDHNTYGLDILQYIGKPGVFLDNYDIRIFRKQYKPKFCIDVKTSVTVQYDGDVVPCCNVVGKQNVLGNLNNESLASIWERSSKEMFSYCDTCKTPSPFAKRLSFLSDTLNS